YSNYTVTLAAAGPFSVSVPSAPGIFWLTGSQQTVTWDVNGTDSLPIGCSLVRISISLNSGNTYSVLVDSTFNDGSETVTVPTLSANISTCRILIEAIDNVFYDISNNNFTITTDVGLSSISKHNPLSLTTWPNPANTTLHFKFTAVVGETMILTLCNTLGQELKKTTYQSSGVTQGEISLEHLEAGLYILQLSNGKYNSAVRFVKE
nr:T9SS type A sorting domain-containing protein [Bacteroidia bacterium]